MDTYTALADTITDSAASMESPLTPKTTLAAVIQPGLTALRKLWLPFVLIQCCGLAAVIGYFQSESVRRFCEHLAELKRAGGYIFSGVAMGIASGFAPEVFKFITGIDRSLGRERWRNIVFNFSLYFFSGIFVDCFYREMAVLFGDSASLSAIAKKMLTDQFIYTPIIGVPWLALTYTWREHRYRPIATARSLGVAWYISRVGPLLVPCWAFWIPMTCLMYSLPPSLTFVYGVCGSAAAATLMIAVAERKVVRSQVETASVISNRPGETAAEPVASSGFTRGDRLN